MIKLMFFTLVLIELIIINNNYVDTSILGPILGRVGRFEEIQSKNGDTILGYLAKFLSLQCDTLAKIQEGEQNDYDEEVIRIHHYAGRQFVSYKVLDAPHLLLQSSTFDPLRMTVVFIHGYRNTPDEPYVEEIAENFYKRGINFLSYASNFYTSDSYIKAVAKTPMLSRTLANFIMSMIDLGYPYDHIYLTGFSLGAQFAGIAGKIIQNERGIMLPRITGIDPATLCFSSPMSMRLSYDDAQYVETIHTTILSFSETQIGHADYYLNGEIDLQPGCETITCSHTRGLLVYAETIMNETAFIGRECESWLLFSMGQCSYNRKMTIMGFGAPVHNRGKFYLRTNAKSPFGMGKFGA